MSIYGMFQGNGPSGFGYNSTAEEVTEGLDLSGRTYLVTGANSGLGEETVRVLRLRGARVIVAARSKEKAQAVCDRPGAGEAIPLVCDLSEPASMRAAVAEVREGGLPLDGIIANAGIMALPKRTVKHSLELQFLTNHIGHFILVTGLLDQLTDDGRVVMLSSAGHTGTYSEGIRFDDLDAAEWYTQWGSYGQSKLANLLFAKHLATTLKPGQRANAVHPGVIVTNLTRHLNGFVDWLYGTFGPIVLTKTIPQGAATQVYVATHPGLEENGLYFSSCNPVAPSQWGRDAKLAEQLWAKTEELVAALDEAP